MSTSHPAQTPIRHHDNGSVPDTTLLESVNEIRDMLSEILSLTRSNSIRSSYPPSSSRGSDLHDDLFTVFAEEVSAMALSAVPVVTPLEYAGLPDAVVPHEKTSRDPSSVYKNQELLLSCMKSVVQLQEDTEQFLLRGENSCPVPAISYLEVLEDNNENTVQNNKHTEQNEEIVTQDGMSDDGRMMAVCERSLLSPTLDHNTVYKLEFSDLESLSNVSDTEYTRELETADLQINKDPLNTEPDGYFSQTVLSCYDLSEDQDNVDIIDNSDNVDIVGNVGINADNSDTVSCTESQSEEEFMTAPPSLLGSQESLLAPESHFSRSRDLQVDEREKNIGWMMVKIEELLRSDRVISSNVEHIRNCLTDLSQREHPNVSPGIVK